MFIHIILRAALLLFPFVVALLMENLPPPAPPDADEFCGSLVMICMGLCAAGWLSSMVRCLAKQARAVPPPRNVHSLISYIMSILCIHVKTLTGAKP